jgi:GDPmannose 4,6-dehydratase
MKKCMLIIGASGQDGFYMTKLGLKNGYYVVCTVRNIAAAQANFKGFSRERLELVELDILQLPQVRKILEKYQPIEIYNFAAYTSGRGMYDNVVRQSEVNGLWVATLLETIKSYSPNSRLCQASSREVFGSSCESPQNEDTKVNPRSPYGAAKSFADQMIKIYRDHYGIFACSAILYNHESPRRRVEFVSRKITSTAARIKLGLAHELALGDIDTVRDWGHASDYVYAMWLMLQASEPNNYVIASGERRTVREMGEVAFGYLNLEFNDFVSFDKAGSRPKESSELVGNSEKIIASLGWERIFTFSDLVFEMVDADMSSLGSKEIHF